MITCYNGYHLSYDKMHNCIIIELPQTAGTIISPGEAVYKRRTDLDVMETVDILRYIQDIFEIKE